LAVSLACLNVTPLTYSQVVPTKDAPRTRLPYESHISTSAPPATSLPAPPLCRDAVSRSVRAILLAGGPGSVPALCAHRATASLPVAPNLNLIDLALRSATGAGVSQLYVLAQQNSSSLLSHVARTYPPVMGPRGGAYVDVLTCSQSHGSQAWYRGSAEAVARNLDEFAGGDTDDEVQDFVIMSGHAVTDLDVLQLLSEHRASGADVTIATTSVDARRAQRMGVVRVANGTGCIQNFVEKPSDLMLQPLRHGSRHTSAAAQYEASMGMYVFKRSALLDLLSFGPGGEPPIHFGRDVIPAALSWGLRVQSVHHEGFWKDVAGLRDYYDVTMRLMTSLSHADLVELYHSPARAAQSLPPAMVYDSVLDNAVVGDGSVVKGSVLRNVVLGNNAHVATGCHLRDSLFLSNDEYSSERMRAAAAVAGQPVPGVGANCVLRGVIVDSNASIGDNCCVVNAAGVREADRASQGWVISEGLVVLMRNAVIPANTVI
jgi:glucose-1-phosphate adenylyltransferase